MTSWQTMLIHYEKKSNHRFCSSVPSSKINHEHIKVERYTSSQFLFRDKENIYKLSTISYFFSFKMNFFTLSIVFFFIGSFLIPITASVSCFGCGGGGNCNDPFRSTSSSLETGVNITNNCGACVVRNNQLNYPFILSIFDYRNRALAMSSHVGVQVPVQPWAFLSLEQVLHAVRIEIIAMEFQNCTTIQSCFFSFSL